MKCHCPLKHWGRGFEYHSRHECLSAFLLFVLFCVGSGLATGLITYPSSRTDCLSIYLSISGSTALYWALAGFFSFLIVYTVDRTP
jgi:hypothetical protein